MLFGKNINVKDSEMLFSRLAGAYKLKSNSLSVTLFEAEERAEGKIKAVQRMVLRDEGTNTMVS